MAKGSQSVAKINDDSIVNLILVLRGQKVMLDSDLARLYGVTTKRLNEQVKRNSERFPRDFMFQLSDAEKQEVVANCDHLARLKFSPTLPYAFTEHGALMLASVLNSPIAVEASIFVVRAFIRLREVIATHKVLAEKLAELDNRVGQHDESIRSLVAAIRQLMSPPPSKTKRIGYQRDGR